MESKYDKTRQHQSLAHGTHCSTSRSTSASCNSRPPVRVKRTIATSNICESMAKRRVVAEGIIACAQSAKQHVQILRSQNRSQELEQRVAPMLRMQCADQRLKGPAQRRQEGSAKSLPAEEEINQQLNSTGAACRPCPM